MRLLKKYIRKLYHLIWFLGIFFFILTPVNAEIETGEQFSEFATHRTGLMRLFFYNGDFALYAYNWPGHTPTLDDFLSGRQYLVRYENNTNDQYGAWAFRPWNPTGAFPAGTYLLTWRIDMETAQARNDIMNGTVNSVDNGVINSVSISSSGNTVYFLVNFTLNVATDTPRFGVTSRLSANWFLRMVDNCYYPQITPSVFYDTSQLQQQQNIIISQNQQMIDTYRQQQDWTRDEIRNQTDTIKQQDEWTRDEIRNVDGTLKDSSIDSSDNTINGLKNQIPTNSVISDLLLLPIRFLQNFVNALNSSCSSFSLGSLLGTNLTMPCINIENYLGSTIWTMIDLIFSGMFVYGLRKKFIQIYQNLTNLKNGGNEVD